MPMASSLDTPGTFTRNVQDEAMLYEIMNGEDPLESTTIKNKDRVDTDIWNTKDLS